MKVLFDEGVPKAIRKHLREYTVHTVPEQGWSSIQNGKLLKLGEQEGYELFITADKNMSYQQALEGRGFAVLVLSTNHWPTLSNALQVIEEAVHQAIPGRVVDVDCGHPLLSTNHTLLDK